MIKWPKTLILLNLAAALALVYLTSSWLQATMPGQNYKSMRRFAGIMENIFEISGQTQDKTLFFGTSIFQFFLNPGHFDEQMKRAELNSRSYNLAFEGLFGPGQLAFTARLDTEFKKRNAKFRASVFELSPACLNRRFYDRHREMLDFVLPSIFLNSATWSEMFVKDAPGTAYLLFDQIFRPASWNVYYSIGDLLGIKREDMTAAWPQLVRLWSDKKFSEPRAWNPINAGLSNWNLPETQADFDAAIADIHEPENWKRMIFVYARGNNVNENFAYSQTVVDRYIDSLNTASNFSERTYVVIMPYAPSFQRIVDKFVDYDFVIRKIRASTSAQIIDLRKALTLADEDFADAMHLKAATMDKITALIAEKMAADLKYQ